MALEPGIRERRATRSGSRTSRADSVVSGGEEAAAPAAVSLREHNEALCRVSVLTHPEAPPAPFLKEKT